MIKYILVDDDQPILDSVKAKIDTIAKYYDLKHVASYDNSRIAFEEINADDYDLLIVDFTMPGFNGLQLAQKIANGKKIIFLTSESNKEKQVINNLDISGYLSKPFEIEEFEAILKNKVIGRINTSSKSNNQLITLHIGSNRDVRFRPEQAYYISTSKNINGEQPDKNCVHIYGKHDTILSKNVRKSINELVKELANYNFKKTNQSTIINMSHVNERDNTFISLFDSKETFEVTAKEKLGFIAKLRAKLNV
ncbi:LytR/AlgR family response regulator transcription factor [Lacinutrix sp. MEBiC02404]